MSKDNVALSDSADVAPSKGQKLHYDIVKYLTETSTKTNIATNVATHLLNKILSYKPNFTRPSLKAWIADIDKAIRI